MDTVRVTYELKNSEAVTRPVGLRVMLDTLIGDNDGVPFIVPGREGIVTTALELGRQRRTRFRTIAGVHGLEQPGRDR